MNATELRPLRAAHAEARETYGPRSSKTQEAFERLFRTAAKLGQPLDGLRRYTTDETERFFAYTIPGPDGHVYWDGGKTFCRNDGKYRVPRRWWWGHVAGEEPGQYEDIVPMCGERNCINPEHCEKGRGLRRSRFTRDQMIGALQVAAIRLGRPPSSSEWDKLGLHPNRKVYQAQFGNWEKAILAAGLDYTKSTSTQFQPAKKGECIAALRFLRGRLGHWPSISEYSAATQALRQAGLPTSPSTIKKLLGGWPAARKKAGARS